MDSPASSSKEDNPAKNSTEESGGDAAKESDNKEADSAESSADKLPQQHVSKILDEVLEEPPDSSGKQRGFKHPMVLDMFLAASLLIAMAGFSIGMFKIYVTHSAKQSINQHNYKAAIALLKGAPFPGFFTMSGSDDTTELLNRALYLDAMERLDENKADAAAIKELQEIRPGSAYFELAQDILRDHTPEAAVQLEGQASHEASPNDPEVKVPKPILPDDEPKDASP